MSAHRVRKTVFATTALLAACALVSACGPEESAGAAADGKASPASSESSGSNEQSGQDSGEAEADQGGTGGSGSSGGSGSTGSTGGSGGSEEEAAKSSPEASASKSKVGGTWFGNVEYLAPGKFTVSDMKDTPRAFFVSTSTKILGAGEICGDAEGQAAETCTNDDLEKATKDGGVSATVKINEDGIATSVTEDH